MIIYSKKFGCKDKLLSNGAGFKGEAAILGKKIKKQGYFLTKSFFRSVKMAVPVFLYC